MERPRSPPTIRYFINQGDGAFIAIDPPLTIPGDVGEKSSRSVSLGDLDGDGDLDAVESISGESTVVWTNLGSGAFVDSGQRLSPDTYMSGARRY